MPADQDLIDLEIRVDVIRLPPRIGTTHERSRPGAIHHYLIYRQEVSAAEYAAAELLLARHNHPAPEEVSA